MSTEPNRWKYDLYKIHGAEGKEKPGKGREDPGGALTDKLCLVPCSLRVLCES